MAGNLEIARKFSEMVVEKFRDLVKAIVLFGSSVRDENARDIDLLIIIDDTLLPWTNQTFSMIFSGVGEILEKFEEREKIHPNVLVLSAFINNILKGEPITINMVRDSIALYDSGIFLTIKRLLNTGKIRPSPEAIVSSHKRAFLSLGRAKWKLLMSVVDIYWAMILAAEAFLMLRGVIPGHPSNVPNQLEGMIEEKYRKWLEEIYKIQKEIAKFNKKEVDFEELREWFERAEEFLNFIDKKIKEEAKKKLKE